LAPAAALAGLMEIPFSTIDPTTGKSLNRPVDYAVPRVFEQPGTLPGNSQID
jgi:hypothetical protein